MAMAMERERIFNRTLGDRIAMSPGPPEVEWVVTNPKFQGGFQKIPIVINDLRQFPVPVSGYGLIN
jgi:hypothetical protein